MNALRVASALFTVYFDIAQLFIHFECYSLLWLRALSSRVLFLLFFCVFRLFWFYVFHSIMSINHKYLCCIDRKMLFSFRFIFFRRICCCRCLCLTTREHCARHTHTPAILSIARGWQAKSVINRWMCIYGLNASQKHTHGLSRMVRRETLSKNENVLRLFNARANPNE